MRRGWMSLKVERKQREVRRGRGAKKYSTLSV